MLCFAFQRFSALGKIYVCYVYCHIAIFDVDVKITNIAKDQWFAHDQVLLFTCEKRETDKSALIVLNDTVLSVRVVPIHSQI